MLSYFDQDRELSYPLAHAFTLFGLEATTRMPEINELLTQPDKVEEAKNKEDDRVGFCYLAAASKITWHMLNTAISQGAISETLILQLRQNYENHSPYNIVQDLTENNIEFIALGNDDDENDDLFILQPFLLKSLNVARNNLSLTFTQAPVEIRLKSAVPAMIQGIGLAMDIIEVANKKHLITPTHEMAGVLNAAYEIKHLSNIAQETNDNDMQYNLKTMKALVDDYLSTSNLAYFERNKYLALPEDPIWDQVRKEAHASWFAAHYDSGMN